MDYTYKDRNGQLTLEQSRDFLKVPNCLKNFTNTATDITEDNNGKETICFRGYLSVEEEDRCCPYCGHRMHLNAGRENHLRHLPFGPYPSAVTFSHCQFQCPQCHKTTSHYVPFKAEGFRITEQLHAYIRDLLSAGTYTLKMIADATGVNENTVKAIDLQRLQEKYCDDDGNLKKPEEQAVYLGIDEFKLHNGHKYATHIINMETGHILWIARGKKKQVVYDFIEHVGLEWMDNVEVVACDMNSDFQEAFEEKCPHIQPVFDYFHIVKNFNDNVIDKVRKDETRRLEAEGDLAAARSLKRCKYILTSSRKTLAKKDTVLPKGKNNALSRYEELIANNKLLLAADLIKTKLSHAYAYDDEIDMANDITEIIELCNSTGNTHFRWFGRLLLNHFEGIVAHATYRISAGKIEGINNRIKTLRRQGYGYPDDDYFFLKLFDMSRSHDRY